MVVTTKRGTHGRGLAMLVAAVMAVGGVYFVVTKGFDGDEDRTVALIVETDPPRPVTIVWVAGVDWDVERFRGDKRVITVEIVSTPAPALVAVFQEESRGGLNCRIEYPLGEIVAHDEVQAGELEGEEPRPCRAIYQIAA